LKTKGFGVQIFLVCLGAILLEVSYTRVFSFKVFHYFTYLTIGIALLGIGSGGVLVSVSRRLREADPAVLIARACVAAGIVVPISYLILSALQLNALDVADSVVEALKLVLACTLLFLPFLIVGVIISTIFGHKPEEIDRLYFADLVGAAVGCMLAIPLFAVITPPGAVMLSGIVFSLAGARAAAADDRRLLPIALAAAVLTLPTVLVPSILPDPITDRVKSMSPQRMADGSGWGGKILFSEWSSVFRVDVGEGPHPDKQHLINHDGNLGSTILAFNGDLASMKEFDVDVRSTPFSVIKKNPEVLIIGAAGGHEILVSLYFGAAHVTGIELNPVTVSLLTDHFADYSGRLAENPKVSLVNGEGRSWIKRDLKKYDLIWFVAPDSYAAMNAASSGAFVLSESYLYTREMIAESLAHLTPGGVICMQTGDVDFDRKPNRALRYLSTARAAYEDSGVDDFSDRVLVSSTRDIFTMVTILLGKDAFSPDAIGHFYQNATLVKPTGDPTIVWHPTLDPAKNDHPIKKMITLDDTAIGAFIDGYRYSMAPVSDDSPFFWHFARFRDVLGQSPDQGDTFLDPEDSKGERVLLTLLAFTAVFASFFLLLPLIALRDVWRRVPYKLNAGIYFAALGLGFMFIEIVLIQKLTLFLGYPSYSLTVTLFAILVFSGIGAFLSGRYAAARNRALGVLLAALAILAVSYEVAIPRLVDGFIGHELGTRILITVALLAPLGLCLGAFMPIGLGTVASLSPEHKEEYVAWGWAVNGFFSVTATVLATILSMTFGFRVVLFMAVAIYAIGIAALTRVPMRHR
jgi:hypothetical protein